MAKRRIKKRTHVGAPGLAPTGQNGPRSSLDKSPKSMVIRAGASDVGPSVSQLVRDFRSMMEPGTAARLKERRSNKLRDFTSMAGPLGVSHLFLFSRSESGNTNLRLAVTPRGPTLNFRIDNYSLCKDLVNVLKRQSASKADYLTAPLVRKHSTCPIDHLLISSSQLVMNNCMTPQSEDKDKDPIPKQLEQLTTSIFQGLFPTISPQSTQLNSIKRVMLLDRIRKTSDSPDDQPPFVLQLRHYSIATPVAKSSLPRPLRRLNAATQSQHTRKRALPNLGRLADMSDYLLDPNAAAGFTSGSDSEPETDAEVEVLLPRTSKVQSRQERLQYRASRQSAPTDAPNEVDQEGDNDQQLTKEMPLPARTRSRVEKKAIKLSELGPRLTLRLTKVEEGLCDGRVMWHEYIHKTRAEEKELEATWAKRNKLREERKAIQKDNVERKKKERGNKGEQEQEQDDGFEDYDDNDDFWDGDEMDVEAAA